MLNGDVGSPRQSPANVSHWRVDAVLTITMMTNIISMTARMAGVMLLTIMPMMITMIMQQWIATRRWPTGGSGRCPRCGTFWKNSRDVAGGADGAGGPPCDGAGGADGEIQS